MTSAPKDEKQIFLETIKQSDREQWPGYLDRLCGDDAQLRRRVEILLEAHLGDESLLDGPAIALAATTDQPITEKPGTQMGSYKLLQKIGEGGMGVVYMAEQREPVKRRVALKIIKPGMGSRQVIARFEAERQALAMMDHQNIARVLDAGTTLSETPYFVMELVRGIPITKFCDERHLSVRERLELMVPVAAAVQHAHQKGIIHRDLKPSNILVAEYDHHAVPKIIDFGVAKALNQQLTDGTVFTRFDQVIGTLEYMSPEQAKFNQLDIDTRSDVYSLGVVLYELLTGTTPFESERLKSLALDELLRMIRENVPPTPSMRLSSSDALPSLAANRGLEPRRLAKLVRGELDWIVMRALDKDRGRRYGSAEDFARDLKRYLNGDTVVACPPSALYRLRKFVHRNRTWIVAAALLLLAIVLGGAGTGSQYMVEYSTHAIEMFTNLTEESPDAERHLENLAGAQTFLGVILATKGNRTEALPLHISALENYRKLAEQNPSVPDYREGLAKAHNSIGYILDAQGKKHDAMREYSSAIAIREPMLERHAAVPEYAKEVIKSYQNLASTQQEVGDRRSAFENAHKAVDTAEKLVAEFSGTPEYDALLASSYDQLGQLHLAQGDLDEAKENLEQALRIATELTKENRNVTLYETGPVAPLRNLASLATKKHERSVARAYYERVIAILKQLEAETRASPRELRQLLLTYANVGDLSESENDNSAAIGYHKQAVAIARQLFEIQSEEPAQRSLIVGTLVNLGLVHLHAGDVENALTNISAAVECGKQLAIEYPDAAQVHEYLATARANLAFVYVKMQRYEDAWSYYRQVVTHEGPDTYKFTGLKASTARFFAGQLQKNSELEDAGSYFQLAVDLGQQLVNSSPTPENSSEMMLACHDYGHYLLHKTDTARARSVFERGLEIGEKLVETHPTALNRNGLANLYFAAGKLETDDFASANAFDHYRRAVELYEGLRQESPETPSYKSSLAKVYTNLGNLTGIEADQRVEFQDQSIEIGEDLVARVPEVLEYRETLLNAYYNRGNTLGSLGRQTEAIESYRKAIAVPGNQPSENSSKDQLERSRIPTLVNLGNAIKKQDQNEAAECYEHAIEIGSRLIEQDPSQLRVQIEVAGGRVNLASIHSSEGDCRTALKLLDTAREALSRALHHQVLGNYARGFLSNALTSERRCFQQLLRHPPQGDDLNLVRDSFTSTINWSQKQLKQWPANHPNHSLCAYHLAYVLNSRAWLLATDPREDVREGEQAFEDADRACRMTAYKAWGYIDTLAAACGELERFPLAANWQQQAIEMAPPEYQQRMQARLELYRAHNAYRQELNDVVKEDASSNQDLDPS